MTGDDRKASLPGGLRIIRKHVLVVTTGRSGSKYFTSLVNRNARNAFSEHEANIVPADLSTQWFYDGDEASITSLVDRKLARLRWGERLASLPFANAVHARIARTGLGSRIPRHPVKEIYVEVDNAALKSWGPALLKAVPDLQVIHLTRDPLLQAKSAENRGTQPNPNQPYFLWPAWARNLLPLSEEVSAALTPFQLALWYWIEMEARYAEFFVKGRETRNMELDLGDLNEIKNVHAVFDWIGIERDDISLSGRRHSGKKKSEISDEDLAQAKELIGLLPDGALDRVTNPYGLKDL